MGYVWCDGYVWDMCGVRYVWDMCGVRYANNLLKNPATKRLSAREAILRQSLGSFVEEKDVKRWQNLNEKKRK